jgi:chromosome segregation ATPase
MSIYQQTLDEDKRLKQALERLEKQAKNQARELPSLGRGESLSEQLLLQHRSKLDDDYQSLQTKASEATKPRIKTAFSRETVVDRLKLHKDNILGRLVDLVSVTEQKYIKVVSLACQDIIDAVITRDTASARHLYDANIKALSLELIPSSNQNQPLLKQIQNPRFPQEFMRGNPKYLVSFCSSIVV